MNLIQHPDQRNAVRLEKPRKIAIETFAALTRRRERKKGLTGSCGPFFARGRDPDQEHCQDDEKGEHVPMCLNSRMSSFSLFLSSLFLSSPFLSLSSLPLFLSLLAGAFSRGAYYQSGNKAGVY